MEECLDGLKIAALGLQTVKINNDKSHKITKSLNIVIQMKKITLIIFSSVHEQAEFNKSCNLIGSGSR